MSMYQKRHYESIAAALGEALCHADDGSSEEKTVHDLSYRIAKLFGEDNPLFDRGRFLDAVSKHAGC